jgi:prophage endopeptidase
VIALKLLGKYWLHILTVAAVVWVGFALYGHGRAGANAEWQKKWAERDLSEALAISANVDAVNQQLIASRAQTEAIRATFIEYKAGKENETSALERAVADGSKRLRIKASCPAVRADGTVPDGAVSGTAELDASVRSDYFLLKKGLDRQFAELQFCRSELRKRSAK